MASNSCAWIAGRRRISGLKSCIDLTEKQLFQIFHTPYPGGRLDFRAGRSPALTLRLSDTLCLE